MWWLGLLIGISIATVTTTPECRPNIRIIEQERKAVVEGTCAPDGQGHHNSELRYELIVERIGSSGISRTRQAGTFTPGTSPADTLSRTSINFSTGDALHVRLLIYAGDRIISSAKIERNLE